MRQRRLRPAIPAAVLLAPVALVRRLRGLFEVCRFGRGRRRWPVALVVLAMVVCGLGLSGCVADAPPIMGVAWAGDGHAAAGDGKAAVSWFPPHAAPVPITAYVVTPWIGFERQTPVVFDSTATTQTVTGLTNGVAYTFTVHALNASGDDSAESGMSNQVVPNLLPVGGPLPPIRSFPQAGETPPPADAITGTVHPGGSPPDCSAWYLQNSYVLQPAGSAWWEYSCTSQWIEPCWGACNADGQGWQTFTDYYYWNGSAPVYYGWWWYDGYHSSTYPGATFCDYWNEAGGQTYGPFAISDSNCYIAP